MTEGNADAGLDADATSDGPPDDVPSEGAPPEDASPGGEPSDEELADMAATDWLAALATVGELRPEIVRAIIETHGTRGRRAIEADSEERVKQYRDFTVVVGHRQEHVVEEGECDCEDAAYNLDAEDPDERCWHALAVDVAERLGRVDHHDMWYSDVREFL